MGLVWAGSPIFVHNGIRSISLDAFAPLAGLPGVQFHSLQKPSQQPGDIPMLDRMAETQDFADTAAIIAGLDLVISVDSAVAHLAAAMGKEVWLLSRFHRLLALAARTGRTAPGIPRCGFSISQRGMSGRR